MVAFLFSKVTSGPSKLLEDVKITEESMSQSGWETACSFHRVREDNVRLFNDSSAAKVHDFMAAQITFAKGSEYACRTTDSHSKGAENALLVYPAVTISWVHYSLGARFARFPPKVSRE